jgi:hypothetical protein
MDLEAADVLVLGTNERGPVMAAAGDVPAEAAGVLGPVGIFGGLDHELLGHAADVDAGATPEAFLGDADPSAVARGDPGAARAAGAAADDEEIEIIGHGCNPVRERWGSALRRTAGPSKLRRGNAGPSGAGLGLDDR